MSRRFTLDRLKNAVRQLSSRRGNVTITFALMAVPMLGAIGLAVDFGTVLTARNKAQVGADAAALQATGVALDLIRVGDDTEAATTKALAEAKRRATALFNAYALENGLTSATVDVKVTRDGSKINASAGYSVGTDTFLAKLYGVSRYEATGVAASSSSLPSYIDVYVAMDNSQSMGLAATQDEMKRLFTATGAAHNNKAQSCVFGCHVIEAGHTKSNETVAKENGIRLRINVLRDAVKDMIKTADTRAEGSASYRFALYLMGAQPDVNSVKSPYTQQLSPISSDFVALDKKANDIGLGFNTRDGIGDTHLNEQIAVIRDTIPIPGDGSSQQKAKSYLFVITDGARDVWGQWCTSGHCMDTINPATCKTVKDKNITVGVLYTTYLPIYKDPYNPAKGLHDNYNALVVKNGLAPKIAPALEQCASPGWYFEASNATEIDKALAKMFEQTSARPALTQ